MSLDELTHSLEHHKKLWKLCQRFQQEGTEQEEEGNRGRGHKGPNNGELERRSIRQMSAKNQQHRGGRNEVCESGKQQRATTSGTAVSKALSSTKAAGGRSDSSKVAHSNLRSANGGPQPHNPVVVNMTEMKRNLSSEIKTIRSSILDYYQSLLLPSSSNNNSKKGPLVAGAATSSVIGRNAETEVKQADELPIDDIISRIRQLRSSNSWIQALGSKLTACTAAITAIGEAVIEYNDKCCAPSSTGGSGVGKPRPRGSASSSSPPSTSLPKAQVEKLLRSKVDRAVSIARNAAVALFENIAELLVERKWTLPEFLAATNSPCRGTDTSLMGSPPPQKVLDLGAGLRQTRGIDVLEQLTTSLKQLRQTTGILQLGFLSDAQLNTPLFVAPVQQDHHDSGSSSIQDHRGTNSSGIGAVPVSQQPKVSTALDIWQQLVTCTRRTDSSDSGPPPTGDVMVGKSQSRPLNKVKSFGAGQAPRRSSGDCEGRPAVDPVLSRSNSAPLVSHPQPQYQHHSSSSVRTSTTATTAQPSTTQLEGQSGSERRREESGAGSEPAGATSSSTGAGAGGANTSLVDLSSVSMHEVSQLTNASQHSRAQTPSFQLCRDNDFTSMMKESVNPHGRDASVVTGLLRRRTAATRRAPQREGVGKQTGGGDSSSMMTTDYSRNSSQLPSLRESPIKQPINEAEEVEVVGSSGEAKHGATPTGPAPLMPLSKEESEKEEQEPTDSRHHHAPSMPTAFEQEPTHREESIPLVQMLSQTLAPRSSGEEPHGFEDEKEHVEEAPAGHHQEEETQAMTRKSSSSLRRKVATAAAVAAPSILSINGGGGGGGDAAPLVNQPIKGGDPLVASASVESLGSLSTLNPADAERHLQLLAVRQQAAARALQRFSKRVAIQAAQARMNAARQEADQLTNELAAAARKDAQSATEAAQLKGKLLAKQEAALVRIVRFFRNVLACRKARYVRQLYRRERRQGQAVTVISNWWLHAVAAYCDQRQFDVYWKGLQRRFRHKRMLDIEVADAAVPLIQRIGRSFLLRKTFKSMQIQQDFTHKEEVLRAAAWRLNAKAEARTRQQYQSEAHQRAVEGALRTQAAVHIQRLFRGWRGRLLAQEELHRRKLDVGWKIRWARRIIGRTMKRFLSMMEVRKRRQEIHLLKQEKVKVEFRHRTAYRIQRWWRELHGRKEAKRLAEERRLEELCALATMPRKLLFRHRIRKELDSITDDYVDRLCSNALHDSFEGSLLQSSPPRSADGRSVPLDLHTDSPDCRELCSPERKARLLEERELKKRVKLTEMDVPPIAAPMTAVAAMSHDVSASLFTHTTGLFALASLSTENKEVSAVAVSALLRLPPILLYTIAAICLPPGSGYIITATPRKHHDEKEVDKHENKDLAALADESEEEEDEEEEEEDEEEEEEERQGDDRAGPEDDDEEEERGYPREDLPPRPESRFEGRYAHGHPRNTSPVPFQTDGDGDEEEEGEGEGEEEEESDSRNEPVNSSHQEDAEPKPKPKPASQSDGRIVPRAPYMTWRNANDLFERALGYGVEWACQTLFPYHNGVPASSSLYLYDNIPEQQNAEAFMLDAFGVSHVDDWVGLLRSNLDTLSRMGDIATKQTAAETGVNIDEIEDEEQKLNAVTRDRRIESCRFVEKIVCHAWRVDTFFSADFRIYQLGVEGMLRSALRKSAHAGKMLQTITVECFGIPAVYRSFYEAQKFRKDFESSRHKHGEVEEGDRREKSEDEEQDGSAPPPLPPPSTPCPSSLDASHQSSMLMEMEPDYFVRWVASHMLDGVPVPPAPPSESEDGSSMQDDEDEEGSEPCSSVTSDSSARGPPSVASSVPPDDEE